MDTRKDRILEILEAAFHPHHLEVRDESSQHAGHAGARPGGETHYRVILASNRFEGMDRISRHRAVNLALETEFSDGLHALALYTYTPKEYMDMQAKAPA